MKLRLLTILCLLIIIPVVWTLVLKMEGEKPILEDGLESPFIGQKKQITIKASDEKSGIRKIWVGLIKDGKEYTVFEKTFSALGWLEGGREKSISVDVDIDTEILGLSDGKGILRIVVRDYSWKKWGKGNTIYVEKEVRIDTQSPKIEVLSTTHNIAQGGSGLVIYKVSESCPKSGVYAGDHFYPGYAGYFKDPDIYLSFFALSYKQGPDTKLYAGASDFADNKGKAGFPYHINKRKFRKDTLNISDRFLSWKMPDFEKSVSGGGSLDLVDQFLKVNQDLRRQNAETVYETVTMSEAKMLWKGVFGRLPGAANRAGFADHRTYTYKGKTIDRQVHLGIDLASTAHSRIPVANTGKVVFAEVLGIYGNTVIVDHGFGLFSLYSHLSSIDTAIGQMVQKGDILGKTGRTGLAGGDHLHFSMLVNSTWVNPIEWWDASWIKNNITAKIKEIEKQ